MHFSKAALDRASDIYWACWLLVLFAVPEFAALLTRQYQRTLSETAWRWFDVVPGQTVTQWKFTHFCLFAFMTWLWFHMVLGLFR